MARLYGLRLGLVVAATLCVSATAQVSYSGNEAAATARSASLDYDRSVIVFAAVDQASFIAPVVLERAKVERSFPAYRQHASPRASGAAVRPTSLAGWRSGRAVRLAG